MKTNEKSLAFTSENDLQSYIETEDLYKPTRKFRLPWQRKDREVPSYSNLSINKNTYK